MRLVHMCAAATLLVTAWSNSAFSESRRELGAHVHGHGTLNMAIDGKTVGLDLRVPGADIVGFEHEAKSEADKTAVSEAKLLLGSPLELFQFTEAAGCKMTSSFAHFSKDPDHAEHHKKHHGSEHGDHEDHAGHHGDGDHHGHKKSEHHGDHPGHQEGHAEFHAGYEFTCAAPEKLTGMSFDYFTAFKNARELTVNVVTAKGQSKFEVTAAKPTLDLGGLM